MPRTTLLLAIAGLALSASLALAEPQFVLRYPGGVPQVSITGDYPGSTYTVWRQPVEGGLPTRITDQTILCMGSCYAQDPSAVPGSSYLYRFELVLPTETGLIPVTFGPYRATISPALARTVGVFVYPNPGRGPTGIQIHLAGAAGEAGLTGDLTVFDPTGRRVRTIQQGVFARGLTTLSWDGRDERGDELRSGVYLLRFSAAGSSAIARIVRR